MLLLFILGCWVRHAAVCVGVRVAHLVSNQQGASLMGQYRHANLPAMALFQTRQQDGNAPAARSLTARVLTGLLGWLIPAFGFVMFFGITLSPWLGDRFTLLFENTVRVQAQVSACEPLRNGTLRENTVRCTFSYSHEGKTYQAQDTAWNSESPFLTSASLEAVLAGQIALTPRPADIRPRHPEAARLVDQRWLAMPPLWFWLLALVVTLLALLIYLDFPVTVYRRADLVVDPGTGQLVDVNNKRRNRLRGLAVLKAFTALVVVLACGYGLSNRPANVVKRIGFAGLQAVPAQLVDCARQRHGSYRGHDQIDCAFEYSFNGQTLRGRAESLDFRNFPTRARMDAEVARLQPPQRTTAYVDPQHPGFALAFISNDWWVPYSWGLWELELWIALLAALVLLALQAFSALRPKP